MSDTVFGVLFGFMLLWVPVICGWSFHGQSPGWQSWFIQWFKPIKDHPRLRPLAHDDPMDNSSTTTLPLDRTTSLDPEIDSSSDQHESFYTSPQSSATPINQTELNSTIAHIEFQITQLQSQNCMLQSECSAATSQLRTHEIAHAKLSAEIEIEHEYSARLENTYTCLCQKVDDLCKKLVKVDTQINVDRDSLNKRINSECTRIAAATCHEMEILRKHMKSPPPSPAPSMQKQESSMQKQEPSMQNVEYQSMMARPHNDILAHTQAVQTPCIYDTHGAHGALSHMTPVISSQTLRQISPQFQESPSSYQRYPFLFQEPEPEPEPESAINDHAIKQIREDIMKRSALRDERMIVNREAQKKRILQRKTRRNNGM